jgi:hypothetical protein
MVTLPPPSFLPWLDSLCTRVAAFELGDHKRLQAGSRGDGLRVPMPRLGTEAKNLRQFHGSNS